jgi:hypothetical protein
VQFPRLIKTFPNRFLAKLFYQWEESWLFFFFGIGPV